jgi:hypothetical protein
MTLYNYYNITMNKIDIYSPYAIDNIKYDPSNLTIDLNTIAIGADEQEWILIKKNNVRIWKRKLTYVCMQKEKFTNNTVIQKEITSTSIKNTVIKKPTDYNIFQKFQLLSMEKGTGRANLDAVNKLWKELKLNKENYIKFFEDKK